MNIDKKVVGAFVLGVIITAVAVHGYTIYQVRQVAFSNQAAVMEIVNFINTSIGQQQPGMLPEGEGMLPEGE